MRIFLWIIAAGLVCSALGGAFGFLIGELSPEFMQLVVGVGPDPITEPGRLGLACGLVCGLLLGAAAMAFGQLLAAFRAWAERVWNAPSPDGATPPAPPGEGRSAASRPASDPAPRGPAR